MTTKNIQDVVAERVEEFEKFFGNSIAPQHEYDVLHKEVTQWLTTTLTQYHQDLIDKLLKEIDEANWHMHLATKSRLKTFIKIIIKLSK